MGDLTTTWQQTLTLLKGSLGEAVFDTWIAPLKASLDDSDGLILGAPDAFFKEWVEKNYKQPIFEALCRQAGKETRVSFEVASNSANALAAPIRPRPKTQDSPFLHNLNARYTFDNFVVGPSNRHAHAYSLAVAEAPAKAYNPLFIYGGVGLGKTHLIQAICHHIKQNSSDALKICYVSSEKFTNELIDAIQHQATSSFRQRYRNADILVIDDIHFIAGKESTQEEFFHTFNALYDAHKQIVFSSDRPPKEIASLQERLVSRFGWGFDHGYTTSGPGDARGNIKKKIEREPVAVPDEVIFFIAQLIKTNIRELEGALIRTIAYSLLEEKAVTLDLAKEVLKDLLKEPKKLITVDFIQRCVSEEFGIPLHDLKTKRRNKTIVLPRQVAMYISRELTELSLPEIGGYFGGKDHTTVLHSYNKIKEELVSKEELKQRVERIINLVKQ